MKKVGYLLLLTPALFLASCQTTPKIDTITPEEAQKIIDKFEQRPDTFVAPNDTSKVSWNVNKGDAKDLIKPYLGHDLPEDKKEDYITEQTRRDSYITELADEPASLFNDVGHDAFIRMNTDLHLKMIKSIPPYPTNETGDYFLKYKKNGGGITIIEESTSQKTIYTRTHFYNESGREDRFEVNVNKESGNLVYTMNIEFHYN